MVRPRRDPFFKIGFLSSGPPREGGGEKAPFVVGVGALQKNFFRRCTVNSYTSQERLLFFLFFIVSPPPPAAASSSSGFQHDLPGGRNLSNKQCELLKTLYESFPHRLSPPGYASPSGGPHHLHLLHRGPVRHRAAAGGGWGSDGGRRDGAAGGTRLVALFKC